jgi:DNA-binding MarR family transcriptional regulator
MFPDSDDLANVGPLGALLSVRLRRVDLLLGRAFSQPEVKSELIVCLAAIASRPGVSQNQLAKIVRADASLIVGFVNQLEQLGWAVRRPSESDRRRHALYATEGGEAELARMAAEFKQFEEDLLTQVAPEELAFFRYLLDRIHASCQQRLAAQGPDADSRPERSGLWRICS